MLAETRRQMIGSKYLESIILYTIRQAKQTEHLLISFIHTWY